MSRGQGKSLPHVVLVLSCWGGFPKKDSGESKCPTIVGWLYFSSTLNHQTGKKIMLSIIQTGKDQKNWYQYRSKWISTHVDLQFLVIVALDPSDVALPTQNGGTNGSHKFLLVAPKIDIVTMRLVWILYKLVPPPVSCCISNSRYIYKL